MNSGNGRIDSEWPSENRFSPFLYLLVAVLAVSFSAILIRLTNTPPLTIAFYRQLFCAVFIFPFVNRDANTSIPAREYALLVLSGLFLALHFGTWITALSYTSIARATLFVDLQPVWAAVLGAVFLNERLSRMEVLGVAIVTAGGAISIAGRWGVPGAALHGDLLALSGGVAGACYLLIGRKLRLKISWIRYIYSVYYLSAVWLLLLCWVMNRAFPLPFEHDLHWIFLMALIPGILGHGLFNLALRYFKAYVVNAAFIGEPILAAMLAFLFFREKPDAYYYSGAAVILTGLLIIFLKQKQTD
jgi:drug/metabolite transporter (DMT)-like permease